MKDIPVTVTYTGKGTVDADHQIVVFLFNEATVGPQSHPIGAPQYVTKNGQTVTFKDVPGTTVYVLGIYGGKYDGRGGPPPAGTPIGFSSAHFFGVSLSSLPSVSVSTQTAPSGPTRMSRMREC